jgi:hypothetical protein
MEGQTGIKPIVPSDYTGRGLITAVSKFIKFPQKVKKELGSKSGIR